MTTRRDFLKHSALGAAGLTIGGLGFSTESFANIMGANEKIRVGIVGFSDRARHSLIPAFMACADELGFEIVAISDIWKRRREEGVAFFQEKYGKKVKAFRNNEELYDAKMCDAVIVATSDFQHALHCIEAVQAGCDAYVEKPFAETMEDARAARKAVLESGKIVQIGSQRRSAPNYHAANDFIRSGKFGKITMFWPYSSGIPGQWMSHQIDTVHWFTGCNHPNSVAANGGIYQWNDGRRSYDTMTAVFDYGKAGENFQVVYSSRMHNSAGGTKELYFSNGGTLNLDTNKVTSEGGLTKRFADEMGMQPNLLEEFKLPSIKVETGSNTGADPMTNLHMRNWMECVKSRKQPNAPVDAGYNHSIANIMCTASLRTGEKATFDEARQEVLAGGKVFKY